MLSRRKRYTSVVEARPGQLAPRRPEGEIWWCTLLCGHIVWRARKNRIEDPPRPAPKKLLCDVCRFPGA